MMKNQQENRTAAIIIKKLRKEMIIIDAVLMLFNNYLTAKVLFIAAVSFLDPKFNVYLPLNIRKRK